MATTEEGFKELLYGEVYLDMERIKDLASHGVPDGVRAQVWKYLLGISRPDPSEAMQLSRFQAQEFEQALNKPSSGAAEFSKVITRPLQRFKNSNKYLFQNNMNNDEIVKTLENIVIAYLNNNPSAEFNPGMFSLIIPFLYVMKEPHHCFLCFEALMKLIDQYFYEHSLTDTIAYFLTCFRSVQPELYNYFEEEELDANNWATPWFQFLLGRALPLECILRLWDTYFSADDGFDLHIYVCLAILMEWQEELMELDHFEIKSYLQHLPPMDMDKIIAQAYNLRAEISKGRILV